MVGHGAPTEDPDAFSATRIGLHSIAEHLLAADLHDHTGRIGLRVTPGGFGQPEFFANGVRRRLRVDGDLLVVLEGDLESRHTRAGTSSHTMMPTPRRTPNALMTPRSSRKPACHLACLPGSANRSEKRSPTTSALAPENDCSCSIREYSRAQPTTTTWQMRMTNPAAQASQPNPAQPHDRWARSAARASASGGAPRP